MGAASVRRIQGNRAIVPIVALAVTLTVLGLTTPRFYNSGNLLNLGQVASVLGIVTVGQTLVLIGGGLDLSVGAMAGMAFFAIANISHGQNSRIRPCSGRHSGPCTRIGPRQRRAGRVAPNSALRRDAGHADRRRGCCQRLVPRRVSGFGPSAAAVAQHQPRGTDLRCLGRVLGGGRRASLSCSAGRCSV